MTSTFDEQWSGWVLADHLAHFGREVTVIPPDGPSRTITAILTEDGRRVDQRQYGEEDQERVWLSCRRDESHADGGIAEPGIGLAFIHPDEAQDSTPFAYQRQRRHVTPGTWDLLFARNRLDAVKPRRT